MTWRRSDVGIGGAGQTVRINDLAVGTVIYAASGLGAYKSSDGGANWSIANEGLNNRFALSLAVDRNNAANVYAGTVSGADAFAAKLNAVGSALNWLTYLGGYLNENGAAIAIDRDGASYITGTTSSPNFPTAGQIQGFGGGATDAFITKLNPDGAAMVWSTYLGNTESESGYDIAVNASNEAYVVGSSAPSLGLREAYIKKVGAAGTLLIWSNSFGGNNSDEAFSVAIDPAGNPFVSGVTESVDFFPLINASQTKLNGFGGTGATDAFVIGFDAVSSEAIWATFLGGDRSDRANGIAVDSRGNVYVAGVSGFGSSAAAATGDCNRDGRSDLVIIGNPPGVSSPTAYGVTVMTTNVNGELDAPRNFQYGVRFPGEDAVSFNAYDAKAADLNGDEVTDLVVTYGQDKVSILLGDGKGGFNAPVGYRTAELSNILVVRDLTFDGKPDLAMLSPNLGRVTLLINDGAGNFPQKKSFATGDSPRAMVVEDFNNDRAPDIVAKGASGGLSLFAGDGRSDLVISGACSFNGAGLYVMLSDNNGSLAAPSLQDSGAVPVAIDDFDGDGKPDVAARQGTNLAILTGRGDGSLSGSSIMTLSTFVAAFAFGVNLSTETASATTIPLPTTLAGVSVKIKDSAGAERDAPLFFVSPGQINYQIPPTIAAGSAVVSVTRNGNYIAAGTIQVTAVNPGLFTANASGYGLAAAVALRVKSDGTPVYEPVSRYDSQQNKLIAVPIDLSNPQEQVFLVLYGTGLRNHNNPSNVNVQVGGVNAEVLFAGPQGGFVGLDQVNVRLPRDLAGRGEVGIVLTADDKIANVVRVNVR